MKLILAALSKPKTYAEKMSEDLGKAIDHMQSEHCKFHDLDCFNWKEITEFVTDILV